MCVCLFINSFDMFNAGYLSLSWRLFTIDNPEFEKYIPDIYPTELQLNKANVNT